MNVYMVIVVAAILVEALVEVTKTWVPEEAAVPGWVWPAVSAALGMVVCVLSDVNVFSVLDVGLSVPVIGNILSGVLISRGSNFMHDLWRNVKTPALVEE